MDHQNDDTTKKLAELESAWATARQHAARVQTPEADEQSRKAERAFRAAVEKSGCPCARCTFVRSPMPAWATSLAREVDAIVRVELPSLLDTHGADGAASLRALAPLTSGREQLAAIETFDSVGALARPRRNDTVLAILSAAQHSIGNLANALISRQECERHFAAASKATLEFTMLSARNGGPPPPLAPMAGAVS